MADTAGRELLLEWLAAETSPVTGWVIAEPSGAGGVGEVVLLTQSKGEDDESTRRLVRLLDALDLSRPELVSFQEVTSASDRSRWIRAVYRQAQPTNPRDTS